MANIDFVVDTNPMASEIHHVSQGVDGVTGAVVAMQTAVVAAEQKGADTVCNNVNKGFYSLMHSQISQKIAQLSSSVEAKLLQLTQYAAALKGIQSRMTKDYNMISARYTKLFKAINNNLETRVAELDMPVFKLVDRDIRLLDSRKRLNSALFSTNQLESILSSQLISASKVKSDTEKAIYAITEYVKDNTKESKKTEETMENISTDSMEDIFIPVFILESTAPIGKPHVNYYVAKSGNEEIDKKIDASVSENSVNAVLNGTWSDIDPNEMANVEAEFSKLLADSKEDDRVKAKIAEMFNNTKNVKKLNP